MKETLKQIVIGISTFLIGGLILLSIIDPYMRNQVANTLSSISLGGEDTLDVIKNPEKYEGEKISLKNVFIKSIFIGGKAISAEESDGNFVHLRYSYYRDIYCIHADLNGVILNTELQQEGLIPVDENGNQVKGSYYFNVTEAKCRD